MSAAKEYFHAAVDLVDSDPNKTQAYIELVRLVKEYPELLTENAHEYSHCGRCGKRIRQLDINWMDNDGSFLCSDNYQFDRPDASIRYHYPRRTV